MSAATAAAVVGTVAGVNSLTGGSISNALGFGSGGGGDGGSGSLYDPQNLNAADAGWLGSFNNVQNLVNQAQGSASPLYNQSLQQGLAINYDPYLQYQQQAGQKYGSLGNIASAQVPAYGQAAQLAAGQQGQLYGAGQQLWNTALDPQNSLYNRTQQQLQDQVRAGQAARGLGNSAVGASLEDEAMSNFNIDWQNQQLQRQLQALQGMGTASNAGGNQGQLMGADLQAMLAAGSQGAGFTGQAGQVPLTAQQFVAAQPGQLASTYANQMGGLANAVAQPAQLALPYMNQGQGAQQFNAQFGAQQNAAGMNALTQGLGALSKTPLPNWLSTTFGSGGYNIPDTSQQTSGLINQYTANTGADFTLG